MSEYKYEIGDKTYIQKPLVWGQITQLTTLLQDIEIPEDINVQSMVLILGGKLPQALSICLTEEGKSPRDKDIQKLASEIEYEIEAETTIEVIEDFFDCNPVASILEKLSGMIRKITESISKAGLKKSVSSSQAETSPKEIKSSGDIPPKTANPT